MKLIVSFLGLFFNLLLFAQSYNYTIDLQNCKSDKLQVELICPSQKTDTAYFNFPMTIPGTYAILDYGKYIYKFTAFNSKGEKLMIKKRGNNTFLIYPATDLHKINYIVEDSWDSKEKKNKIFEPAGTGFEVSEYFYINAGGLMGFFENNLNIPFHIKYIKSSELNGFTSLKETSKNAKEQSFVALNYHELIDNPVLFTAEKEQMLKISATDVLIASYYKESDSSAFYVKEKIDSAMFALDKFVNGQLPVSKYSFLNYVVDLKDMGKILTKGKIGVFGYIKLYRKLGGQGFGALEHGNSSSYYLPDFGNHSYTSMLYETAIHEFLHIYAPLSLHSTYIGDFNYIKPVMSKHLWLYEGVTEYFSVLVAMQGNLISIDKTIEDNLKGKIQNSYFYPDSIPFTTMSANVFEKPYIDHYGQVYTRGAIMAMLLDIEIMRLTNGTKTLKTVIFDLCQRYGSARSFDEESFIQEFVSEVHPDLQNFFDQFVTGTKPLAIQEGFALIGIDYAKTKKGTLPMDILSMEDNKVKVNRGIVVNNSLIVQKADPSNYAGLKKGDHVNLTELEQCYLNSDGSYVSEGTMVTIQVLRGNEKISLTFPAKFKTGTTNNSIGRMATLTEEQEKLFKLWSTGSL